MTPEEAGQRILEGNPYIDCPFPHYEKALEDGTRTVFFNNCPLCKGTAAILDPDYFLACSLLGLPVPNQRVIGWQAYALAEVVSKMVFVGTPGPGGDWMKYK